MQHVLFRDESKKKEIIHVHRDKLVISPFNPRRTRTETDIKRLAERIERNGYEITRALWAYPNNGHYEVFAGGSRLEAVKRTSVETVPVVLHDGYAEDEITRLADEDNENDEYHAPVSVVDVWMDYKRLADMGWTQERIAKAKGVDRTQVTRRLMFAAFPENVLDLFVKNDFLREGHATEIDRLCNFHNLAPWLTREQAMLEVVESVIKDKKNKPKAKDFQEAVGVLNAVIEYVQKAADGLDKITLYNEGEAYAWDARADYISRCAKAKVRTLQAAKDAEHGTRQIISENLRKHQEYMAEKAKEAEAAAVLLQSIEVMNGEWWRLGKHLLYCGDTSQPTFYDRVTECAFAFADPPYNAEVDEWDKDFVWSHDWLIDKAPIVAVTPGIASIKSFLCKTNMPYAWSLSCWIDNGMTRGGIGFGSWIYIAMFATESLYRGAQDMIRVSVKENVSERFKGFKGQKPPDLMVSLLGLFAKPGDTVVDPFLGSGTTLLAAEQMELSCIGGEKQPHLCKSIIEEWQDRTGMKAEKI